MLKSYTGRNCPFCVTPIQAGVSTVVCATCKTPHHKDCWNYNLDKCATFGCKGKEILEESYQFDSSKSVENELIIPSAPLKTEVKQLNLKPKKFPRKNANSIGNIAKKVIANFNNTAVPEPTPYIPEYVNSDLKEYNKGNQPQPRRRFPRLANIETNSKDPEYQPVPTPENYIPEYVNEELIKPSPPKPSNKLVFKKVFNPPKMDKFNKKKEEVYTPPPTPEHYIPEYVNAEMPVIPRKRKKNDYRISPLVIIPNRAPRTDYIPVEDPEPYIPDYVNSEFSEEVLAMIPESIMSTKNCPNCYARIKVTDTTCQYCHKSVRKETNLPKRTYVSYVQSPEIIIGDNLPECITLFANIPEIKTIDFSVDGKYISFAGKDRNVKIFDIDYRECVRNMSGHTNYINAISFSPDSKTIASAGLDRTIKIWDINSGECLKTITGNTMGFNYIVYSIDSGYILSCSGEGMTKIWDANIGICVRTFKVDLNWVNMAAFSMNLKYIASADTDALIRIWSVESCENINILNGHYDSVNSVVFTLDNKFFVSAGNDRVIKVWDVNTWKPIKTLVGHTDSITSMICSPDGRYIASGSKDGSVKIWEIESWRCVKTIAGHSSWVNSVGYSPDGRFLASGGEDKVVKIWRLF